MRKILVPLLLAAVVVLAVFLYPRLARRGADGEGVSGVGTVEVTYVDIAPKLPGYIAELRIDAGQTVEAGEVAARIDRPDLAEQLAADEATLARARSLLLDLEKGPRAEEVAASAADVAAAASQATNARIEYERYAALYAKGATTREVLDSYRNARDVADSSLAAAEAHHRLLLEGTRPDQIEAQRHDVARAEAAVRNTRTQIADTTLVCPLGGVVLSKNLERGDYVAAGQSVATVGDMGDAWVRIYVPSPQLGLLRLRQRAEIVVDAYPGQIFTGWVKEISNRAEFTPRQTLTKHDRANTVYAVKVQLDDAGGVLKPGMPVEVRLP